jgi:hypothetical protein
MTDHMRFRLLAAESVDVVLPVADAADLARHLEGCATCTAELQALRSDYRRLGDLGSMDVPAEIREAVLLRARRGDRPRPWLLLAAAALVLLALGAALLAAGAILRSNRLQLTEAWQAIPADALGSGASASRVRAITSTAAGFFAVGSAGGKAAVWWSEDGRAWFVTTDLPDGDGAELAAVELGGPGLIAAGRSGRASAIWVSADGRTWSPADPASDVADLSINTIAPGPLGWLAIGAGLGPRGTSGVAVASADGARWTRTDPLDLGRPIPPLQTGGAMPDGRWAVISSLEAGDNTGPYTSIDGLAWTAAPELAEMRGLGGFVAFRDRTVAFNLRSTTVRWSRDAVAWNDASVPAESGEAIETITVLHSDEVALLGTGRSGPLLLRSSDAQDWTRDDISGEAGRSTAYDMATLGRVEVVVGIRDGVSAIWIRER